MSAPLPPPASPPTATEAREAWLRTLPNKLTLGRIAAIPLLLLLYPLNIPKLNIFCAFIFALAAITDWVDGYLARRYHAVTPLGALLDPIADKMLVAATLVMLGYNRVVPVFVAALLICRDIGVNGLRLMAMEQQLTIPVNDFGKWKTTVLSVAIFCLIINEPLFDWPFRTVGMISLWISLGLSLYSAYTYGLGFLRISKFDILGK